VEYGDADFRPHTALGVVEQDIMRRPWVSVYEFDELEEDDRLGGGVVVIQQRAQKPSLLNIESPCVCI
jgi:hypothetical protein